MAFDVNKLKKDNHEDILLSDYLIDISNKFNKQINEYEFENSLHALIQNWTHNEIYTFMLEVYCEDDDNNYTRLGITHKNYDMTHLNFFRLDGINWQDEKLPKKLRKELANVCSTYLCNRLENLQLKIISVKENGFFDCEGYKIKFKLE